MKISDSELEVLNVIWNKKQATSIEIIEELKLKNWSNNTVRTFIKRLLGKGAIKKVNKVGKTYTYTAKINEDKYKSQALKHFIDTVFRGNKEEFIKVMEAINENRD